MLWLSTLPSRQPAAFEPLSRMKFETLLETVCPETVSVVKFQAPWDSVLHNVNTLVEQVTEQWPEAHFYSMNLERGTSIGERVYAAHREKLRAQLPGEAYCGSPYLEVYIGAERVEHLSVPRADADDACPLFPEPTHVERLQAAIATARDRLSANSRWQERRRVLLALRQVRKDLRRLTAYRTSGLLSRKWELIKQADMPKGLMAPAKRLAARRKHLQGLVAHATEVQALHRVEARLARRQRLLSRLVLREQRCAFDGCELVM